MERSEEHCKVAAGAAKRPGTSNFGTVNHLNFASLIQILMYSSYLDMTEMEPDS